MNKKTTKKQTAKNAVKKTAQPDPQPAEQPKAPAKPKYELRPCFKVVAVVNGRDEFVAYAADENAVQDEIDRDLAWRNQCGSPVSQYVVTSASVHQIPLF